jgi:hypothetical protein
MRYMDAVQPDPSALFAMIREDAPPADAEAMVWVMERALAVGRLDRRLLDHLAAAAVCALAYRDEETPRQVLEKLFRRAIDDERWRRDYGSLLSL